MRHYVFPKWTNGLLPALVVTAAVVPMYVIFLVAYGLSPKTINVGYQPDQPIPYDHSLHAGELGIDCRYCHNTVETAAKAAIPPTQTCMNCHNLIHVNSPKLAPLRRSFETGEPVEWVRVHDLPDYVYFDHSAHVTRGVSCVECHGRVDRMIEVYQNEPLSMGWCLQCHRKDHVEKVRDPKDVTNLGWMFENDAASQAKFGTEEEYREYWLGLNNINPSQDCSTCHR